MSDHISLRKLIEILIMLGRVERPKNFSKGPYQTPEDAEVNRIMQVRR